MIRTYINTFQIGVVAGMRSMLAPALVSYKLSHTSPEPLTQSKLHFLVSPKATMALELMAGGELIGDKLPSAPDRTGQPQLWGRIASGAMCGAALTEADKQPIAYGAVLGAVGAAVGSFAFFHLRHWLTHEKDIPDPIIALAEDALAIGVGLMIIKGND
ncbi:DUF4126 family protein [Spirosoma sp. KCTC 42546]|uniref:DUF4126 family protein n=1 Tax=Spirosoma sp. KCTC 42546 TaxID=2520506 RepID=UPI00115ADE0A|nr:DUF4126 family protein [Spirosoma sp. KCTC 42546]QDK82381.1 DUF4126 family protein [Spirosoma sp. KCTC 42546]